jgi:hypothetical protein
VICHRPADDAPAENVEYDRDEQEASQGRYVYVISATHN